MNTSQTKAAEFNSINAGAPVAYNVNSPCVYTPNTSPVYIATVGKDSYLASPAVKRTLLIVAVSGAITLVYFYLLFAITSRLCRGEIQWTLKNEKMQNAILSQYHDF